MTNRLRILIFVITILSILCLFGSAGCRRYIFVRESIKIVKDDNVISNFSLETGDSDWDLLMLRLVNRARLDPSGESVRLGSATIETRVPVPPLAYQRLVGNAATNHNTWMHANLGQIASGKVPDSFAHYETLDGTSAGSPAIGLPSYTGANPGQRLVAAGYPWNSYGENILVSYSGNPILINEAKIISNHKGWWNSSGHRDNMLSVNFSSFGHKVESRSFVPPLGGLNAPVDNIQFSTEVFAKPLNPRTYIFGVLYVDRDENGEWTPRGDNGVTLKEVSPLRDMDGDGDADLRDYAICQRMMGLKEGLNDEFFDVRMNGSGGLVGCDSTMGNGAFSVKIGDGIYDVVFNRLNVVIRGVSVLGNNVDVGDTPVILGK